MTDPTEGWASYQRLVLAKLNDLSRDVRVLEERSVRQEAQLASLRTSAGGWGLIAGAVPAAIAIIWTILRK